MIFPVHLVQKLTENYLIFMASLETELIDDEKNVKQDFRELPWNTFDAKDKVYNSVKIKESFLLNFGPILSEKNLHN